MPPKMCDSHQPKNMIMGYIQYSEWMDKQRGQQRQCPTCEHWFFRGEYGPGWTKAKREP